MPIAVCDFTNPDAELDKTIIAISDNIKGDWTKSMRAVRIGNY